VLAELLQVVDEHKVEWGPPLDAGRGRGARRLREKVGHRRHSRGRILRRQAITKDGQVRNRIHRADHG
jgi:hypothetical protein